MEKEFQDRLTEVLLDLLKKSKNKAKFAEEMKSYAQVINRHIKQENIPQADFILRLCHIKNLNPIWLFLGVGERYLPENYLDTQGNINYKRINENNKEVHSFANANELLRQDNKALKRENEILREMIEIYKKGA